MRLEEVCEPRREVETTSEQDNASLRPNRTSSPREDPIGAEVLERGGVDFRVWAPECEKAVLQLSRGGQFGAGETTEFAMAREPEGYWRVTVKEAAPGMFYKFKLRAEAFPDPASRFQPEGPHGPSQIIDPKGFAWTDQAWRGVTQRGQVLYEMHIGTFTPEGTWRAAQEQLRELAGLGITVIELMPVADFPGRFGWGYDGVSLYAPTRLYGVPDDFRAFVNHAHTLGIGVILDVVYNHFGPDGNYLKHFSRDYFTDRYKNEWGEPINFDGPNSKPVREFFITNAAYWVKEFHLDGLRLDATQQIFDCSAPHILEQITRAARQAAGSRSAFVVAENEPQQPRLLRSSKAGGYDMDAIWNDDFHHSARVALTGRMEAYYTDYRGTPQEFISSAKRGFLYQGQWYAWQKKTRGGDTRGIAPEQFINYLQNHDQVANSLRGLRAHQLASAGKLRALTALLLLGPGTPMLFQGQEFAASSPFLYFADHQPDLARLVADGRREFLRQFPSIACPESDPYLAEPHSEKTFTLSKLNFAERGTHQEWYQLHKDLLKLRREDPVFSKPGPGGVDGAVLDSSAFVLRFFGQDNAERLLLVNLGPDLKLSPTPEPLLAPPDQCVWKLLWSSESPAYGGCGSPEPPLDETWRLTSESALVLVPEAVTGGDTPQE
jgi:maltooligosyltrehalose trehalohydrolase